MFVEKVQQYGADVPSVTTVIRKLNDRYHAVSHERRRESFLTLGQLLD